jgi:hypothetical protein
MPEIICDSMEIRQKKQGAEIDFFVNRTLVARMVHPGVDFGRGDTLNLRGLKVHFDVSFTYLNAAPGSEG